MSGGVRHYSDNFNPSNLIPVNSNVNRYWYLDSWGNIRVSSYQYEDDDSNKRCTRMFGVRTSINLSPFKYLRLRALPNWQYNSTFKKGAYLRVYFFNTTGNKDRLSYKELYYDGYCTGIDNGLINPTYNFDISDINQQVFIGFQFRHPNAGLLDNDTLKEGYIQSIEFLTT